MPRDIRMSEVIEALEGPIAPMVCATDHGGRPTAIPNRVAGRRTAMSSRLWVQVRVAVMGALDSMTLAELAGPVPPIPTIALPIHPASLSVAERPSTTEPIPHA